MPRNDLRGSLKTEIRKAAKLGNIQAGMPAALRFLPAMALAAGGAVSKFTDGSNVVEELMLGPDETFLLSGPKKVADSHSTKTTFVRGYPGVTMMCGTCGTLPPSGLLARNLAYAEGIGTADNLLSARYCGSGAKIITCKKCKLERQKPS